MQLKFICCRTGIFLKVEQASCLFLKVEQASCLFLGMLDEVTQKRR
ncbi:hypothetical protein QUA00_01425 [Microcoleus sp. T2B6]